MKKNKKGFVLLEVIISTALSSILLLMTLSCLNVFNDTAEKSEEIIQTYPAFDEAVLEFLSDVKGCDKLSTVGENTLEITRGDRGILYEIREKTLFRNGRELLKVEYGTFLLDGDFIITDVKPKGMREVTLKLRP